MSWKISCMLSWVKSSTWKLRTALLKMWVFSLPDYQKHLKRVAFFFQALVHVWSGMLCICCVQQQNCRSLTSCSICTTPSSKMLTSQPLRVWKNSTALSTKTTTKRNGQVVYFIPPPFLLQLSTSLEEEEIRMELSHRLSLQFSFSSLTLSLSLSSLLWESTSSALDSPWSFMPYKSYYMANPISSLLYLSLSLWPRAPRSLMPRLMANPIPYISLSLSVCV